MKKILFLILALLPMLAGVQAVEIEGIYYVFDADAKQATVCFGENKYTGDIVIPESVTYDGETYSVTSIGLDAFYHCSGLNSVTIPNSVTSIGQYAFYRSTGLNSVTIGESVTTIGDRAFSGCTSLTSVNIPNSVSSIGGSAFYGCRGLSSVTIGNSVTSIGDETFRGCTGLSSVTIGNSVTSIGGYTFYGCTGLTSVTIGNSVTSIGGSAFSGCTSLSSVTIPNSVTSIGDNAFFACKGLTSVTIGNSVTLIGSSAFYGCTGLTSVTIPESVTKIVDRAFEGCTGLIEINIGSGIETIESYVFANCPNLERVFCHAVNVPSTSNDTFYGSMIDYATLFVPEESLEAYRATSPWSDFGTIRSLSDYILVTSIVLNHSDYVLNGIGEAVQLEANVLPENALDRSVKWSSSNESVAVVDANGRVTSVAPGTATITATATDGSGVQATCEVTVKDETPVTGIKAPQNADKIFNAQGMSIPNLRKGMNIIQKKNGKSVKIVVQ